MAQVLRVDQEIFLRLAEETRGGLHRNLITDAFVLDDILLRLMFEPRIVAFLNPLPLSARAAPVSEASGTKRGGNKKLERLKEDNKRMRQQLQNKKPNGDAQKGKGGGKVGKSTGSSSGAGRGQVRLPKELIGLSPTVDGISTCFDFNMHKGCQRTIDGNGACAKGRHACMRCESTGHGAASSRCNKKG